MNRLALLCVLAAFGVGLLAPIRGARGQQTAAADFRKQFQQGNFKDAYDGLSPLVLAALGDDKLEGDFLICIESLQSLGRTDEVDAFREKAIAAHAGDWRFLLAAAESIRDNEHAGWIVSGVFRRGNSRNGDGKWVSAFERDRVRALQLIGQAMQLMGQDANVPAADAADCYYQLAATLLAGEYGWDAWRLGALTDLTTLPDYDENYSPYRFYGGNDGPRGAAVDEQGNPIIQQIPTGGYETALTDGQRWRWAIEKATELSPVEAQRARTMLAQFWLSQFGVQTLAGFGRMGEASGDGMADDSGPFAVHSLHDDETIARFATGIKRFKLEEEVNPIKLFESIGANTVEKTFAAQAMDSLVSIYEDRQQFDTAAMWGRKVIQQFGDPQGDRQRELDQIIGNWGRFDDVLVQPAGGAGAKVDFVFRNATKVTFSAQEIDFVKLLVDLKDYIKSKPKELDWQRLQLNQLGTWLIEQNQAKYIGAVAAKWDLDLQPRPGHFDRRVTVQTPLTRGGAYLLTAHVAGGNTTRCIVWVADAVLVRKQLPGQSLSFVADADTGAPIENARVEFFGYRQTWVQNQEYRLDTQEYAANTNADGELIVDGVDDPGQNNPIPAIDPLHPALDGGLDWLAIATTPDGRMAFTGFDSIWVAAARDNYDFYYNQVKAFIMTDRPVYRPDQKVQFKAWVGENKYDQDAKSRFAGQHDSLVIYNPRGEVVKSIEGQLDEWGGISGEIDLGHDAPLGVYLIREMGLGSRTGVSFRVEEYKKPEFEVAVDAPSEPVMLGDKITATISARYYFGSPVVNAKVHYKVTRSTYDARWYPVARWDWFYEPGYWWFAGDYLWYPGFLRWGMLRPSHDWMPWIFAREQPEVVSEADAPIGADGTVKVEIDTAVAKAAYGDRDHKYTITAEVTDASRRTIVGTGDVLVARDPFRVFAWVDSGYYTAGETAHAYFSAHTLSNKPVAGKGLLKLYRITYDTAGKPSEEQVQQWDLNTDAQGESDEQFVAARAGQYRWSYTVTDAANHTMEGGYIFLVRGTGLTGSDYRFNDIELTTDKQEYKAGDKVRLLINTNRENATVLLFVRPIDGIYLPPKVIHMTGKSMVEEIDIGLKDMPNFFVEALTISGAKVSTDVREIVVPPANRMLDVAVSSDAKEYKPGQKATLTVKVTQDGKPFSGATVLTLYDKALEYISGGTNIEDIRQFFWKWRRNHTVSQVSSLDKSSGAGIKRDEIAMSDLGVFGYLDTETGDDLRGAGFFPGNLQVRALEEAVFKSGFGGGVSLGAQAAAAAAPESTIGTNSVALGGGGGGGGRRRGGMNNGLYQSALVYKVAGPGNPDVQPAVRSNFADTALWSPKLVTATDGIATVDVTMPENLTTWKARVWTLGDGSRVGQGDTEIVTRKNLIIRLEAPRFFVQTDDVDISAIVHNYLKTAKHVKVQLELDGGYMVNRDGPQSLADASGQSAQQAEIDVAANAEQRVDFHVHAAAEGTAVVRVKALTDEESDAMQMSLPVYVHGMLKTESFSGALRPGAAGDGGELTGQLKFTVPAQRRVEQSLLEVRYSPSLASAMVDALPYMVDYPYGCTEQTLNRFLPTVITQKILREMHVDLAAVAAKRTDLNAQEIGDASVRAAQWKRFDRNPVFDEAEVAAMASDGVAKLEEMQNSDGGWGWFFGYGENSYPDTTAQVMHGLQIAQQNGININAQVLQRGVEWLKRDQAARLAWITAKRSERKAENMDAFEYMVLADYDQDSPDMRAIIYEDRNELSVYTKAMFGLAMIKVNDHEKLDMMLQNCRQYVVQDDEDQTAYLKLPPDGWYYWWGSENESQAYYLKLLAKTDPKGQVASRLAKYILNNRKNGTYWNSTRDTALCIEALADYIRASGEAAPDMTVKLALDGKEVKSEHITADNLFTFDNRFLLGGAALLDGPHTLQVSRTGSGPLYYNAYLTNFTLEPHISAAGLEIKVSRKVYLLSRVDRTIKGEGSRGQAVDQRVEKYARTELTEGQSVKSGDLVEVELTVDSKNDYEYILVEDMKAAGFEPVEVQSGYNGNDLHAYVEYHDDRVAFFVRELGLGTHSVSYRLRAEVPGAFSALPAKASAMYAPELKANSDEIRLKITDAPSPIK